MTIRTRLLAGVCAASLALPPIPSHAAGIAVFDATNYAQWIVSLGTQAKQFATENLMWLKQVQQYATQVQQYLIEAEQLYGFIHMPSLGAAGMMLNQVGLGNDMPMNPMSAVSLINGFRYGGGGFASIAGLTGTLSSLTNSVYTQNHVYTPTDGSWASQELIARGNALNGAEGASMTAYQNFQSHASTLQALRDRLATATTPKDVQDAQAQIELENTWNVNELGQHMAIQSAAQSQDYIAAQRDNEKLNQDIEAVIASANIPKD